jgi:hypothetical protein
MAESPEHAFLSDTALSIMADLSSSRLYAYREAERRRLDFACYLVNNCKKVVAGQTIWKHSEGIDKDMRMLLSDREADCLVYLARDTIKNRSIIHEAVFDYKNTPLADSLPRFRVFWIPEGFDADKEDHRKVVCRDLKQSISGDLLLSIVFGGINSGDIRSFVSLGEETGSGLAALATIERFGFRKLAVFGSEVGIGPIRAKSEIQKLVATGLIERDDDCVTSESIYRVHPKGRALLDICGRLYHARGAHGDLGPEFSYICSLLGIDVKEVDVWNTYAPQFRTSRSDSVSARLSWELSGFASHCDTKLDLPDPHYHVPDGDILK